MTGETSERLVFISHAGEDTWIAQQIAREVASRGARPILDQAEAAGKRVAEVVEHLSHQIAAEAE